MKPLKKPLEPQQCGDRVRIRVPMNKQYKSIYCGKWGNPPDMAKATELGIRIYRDSNAGCFDPSLETYRAMVKTGEVPLSYSKESLIEALTLEYQQTPTNAKRNVLSKLRGYSQPINNERQALAFYNTIVASVKSSSAGVYLTALKQVSPLFKNIKRPRYQKPDVEPLSLDQLKAILEAVSGSHYGPLFNLLALTG